VNSIRDFLAEFWNRANIMIHSAPIFNSLFILGVAESKSPFTRRFWRAIISNNLFQTGDSQIANSRPLQPLFQTRSDTESPLAIRRIVNRIHNSRFCESPCERALTCERFIQKILGPVHTWIQNQWFFSESRFRWGRNSPQRNHDSHPLPNRKKR